MAAQAKHAAGIRAAISRDPADVKEAARLLHEEMAVQGMLDGHDEG